LSRADSIRHSNYTVLSPGSGVSGREREQFACDVMAGLSAIRKSIPCKYFYDSVGSELFSRIMELPEYYLTDCEMEILDTYGHIISEKVFMRGMNIVELGAGNGLKTRVLLDRLLERGMCFSYNPIDISESAVRRLSSELLETPDCLAVHGLVAEYFEGIRWLSEKERCRCLVLFLGSSIGNFCSRERESFLTSLRSAMGSGDYLLVGFDLKKNIEVIMRAYDDSLGVTAEFNLNLLRRINRELGGAFDVRKFEFRSVWDPQEQAVQSFLVSTERQSIHVAGLERTFEFDSQEPIHTESSYKFTRYGVDILASRTGFEPMGNFTDRKGYFMNALWKVGR